MNDSDFHKGSPGDNSAAETPSAAPASPQPDVPQPDPSGHTRRRRHPLRLTLKIIGWIILAVILLPVLLYIPPVQMLLTNVASDVVERQTGMKVEIGSFRLRFPLDISLQDLTVIEQSGDTMVNARQALVDIRLLPLLKLDVKVKRLQLEDGYYRMVSPDSSMIMKIRAGFLEVDDKTNVEIRKSEINLNRATLKDGDVSLYMDVWKKKPSAEQDTSATPFIIRVNDLHAERLRFAMSMLPTIDTLTFHTDNLNLDGAVIDLSTYNITARSLTTSDGGFSYIVPTAEYIASHPAPVDTISPPSPPMTIKADTISLSGFDCLYATDGVKPAPGFDAGYVQVSNVGISLKNFYNKASEVRLPITRLQARERCGLQIVDGRGTIAIDSTGLALQKVEISTLYSKVKATAGIPFALMALKPDAPVDASATLSIGLPDVEAFMPSLKTYTAALPRRVPLTAALDAHGTLESVDVDRLDAAMAGFFSLRASGFARNALDYKKLVASLDIDGELRDSAPLAAIAGDMGVDIPSFKIDGNATAHGQAYTADLRVSSPEGDVAAKGSVSLTAESYLADISARDLNIGHFVKGAGLGRASLSLQASGAGFNPTLPRAHTDIRADITSIEYNRATLRDITLSGELADNNYQIKAASLNRELDFDMDLHGHVRPDDYAATGYIRCRHADLRALGLDSALNEGSFDVTLDATASPEKWLYDADITVDNLDWNLPDNIIHLPEGINARLLALADNVTLNIDGRLTSIDFTSNTGLKEVVDGFMAAADVATAQIENRRFAMDSIQEHLPPFELNVKASGHGMLETFLSPSGIAIDTVAMTARNDSLFRLDGGVLDLRTGTMTLDTLTLGLNQRGSLLDYALHLGNRPGTLDEFAKVNLNGYVGANRLSAFLNQQNIEGETGYRLGLTAAMQDSTLSIHFTPLKSTLAYMPWTLNNDNYIDLNLANLDVDANLQATSRESSILLETVPGADQLKELHVNLTNIRIQDFLQMSMYAPPLTATVNSDIRVRYDHHDLVGRGKIDISDFTYEQVRVGDFSLGMQAGMMGDGSSKADAILSINGQQAARFSTRLVERTDSASGASDGLVPDYLKLNLTRFPLSVANAFLGADVASLSGFVTGEMDMSGKFSAPVLDGSIQCDSVAVFIPMIGSSLRLSDSPLTVASNVLHFDDFRIYGANDNPLAINGTVDASKFSAIAFNLNAAAKDFMLINNDQRSGGDLYGKLLLDLTAAVKGPASHFDINANLSVSGKTDITYNVPQTVSSMQTSSENDVVKFVSFADTTAVAASDSVARQMLMRINAGVTIAPGTQVKVNASSPIYSAKVSLQPSGTLSYVQNFMGDMTLNGQLNTGPGSAKVSLKIMSEKDFELDPASFVLWNGQLMNPVLNIKASETQKVNVLQNGNSHLVNFLIQMAVTNTLSAPRIAFDLTAEDDMSIQNQLQSLSAEQRSSQAMNLLITGQYTAEGVSTDSGPLMGNVYNLLASQLNAIAANSIRGVDLSFGIDQYDKTLNGQSSTTTSYSYQVSKSLFNNRFKINVGGNYATDASADENLTQNLLSDISFEYIFKQTETLTLYGKLFRHNGYESILEGEVTETGLGFVMTRSLGSLKNLFRFRRKPKALPTDSIPDSESRDSLPKPEATPVSDNTDKTEK